MGSGKNLHRQKYRAASEGPCPCDGIHPEALKLCWHRASSCTLPQNEIIVCFQRDSLQNCTFPYPIIVTKETHVSWESIFGYKQSHHVNLLHYSATLIGGVWLFRDREGHEDKARRSSGGPAQFPDALGCRLNGWPQGKAFWVPVCVSKQRLYWRFWSEPESLLCGAHIFSWPPLFCPFVYSASSLSLLSHLKQNVPLKLMRKWKIPQS